VRVSDNSIIRDVMTEMNVYVPRVGMSRMCVSNTVKVFYSGIYVVSLSLGGRPLFYRLVVAEV
jgi:hypothetical protein